jgi:ABC-type Fe3+ transport system permease subunit
MRCADADLLGPRHRHPVRLGLLLALLVNQKLRGRLIFRTLFFMPVILGVVIQGLMWKLFLLPGGGSDGTRCSGGSGWSPSSSAGPLRRSTG